MRPTCSSRSPRRRLDGIGVFAPIVQRLANRAYDLGAYGLGHISCNATCPCGDARQDWYATVFKYVSRGRCRWKKVRRGSAPRVEIGCGDACRSPVDALAAEAGDLDAEGPASCDCTEIIARKEIDE